MKTQWNINGKSIKNQWKTNSNQCTINEISTITTERNPKSLKSFEPKSLKSQPESTQNHWNQKNHHRTQPQITDITQITTKIRPQITKITKILAIISKPGNHTYASETTPMGPSKPELKNWQKMKKIEIQGTASNDTESIQIAPRDYQKLEFWPNSKIFSFSRNSPNSMPIHAFDSKSAHLPFCGGPEGRKWGKIGHWG